MLTSLLIAFYFSMVQPSFEPASKLKFNVSEIDLCNSSVHDFLEFHFQVTNSSTSSFRFVCLNRSAMDSVENCNWSSCDGTYFYPFSVSYGVNQSIFKKGDIIKLQYSTKFWCSYPFGYGDEWLDYPSSPVHIPNY